MLRDARSKQPKNESEYEALIFGLLLARDMSVQNLDVVCDSQLIAIQIQGTYTPIDEGMEAYLNVVRHFKEFSIQQVPRELNSEANTLTGLGSTLEPIEFPVVPLVHVLSPTTS